MKEQRRQVDAAPPGYIRAGRRDWGHVWRREQRLGARIGGTNSSWTPGSGASVGKKERRRQRSELGGFGGAASGSGRGFVAAAVGARGERSPGLDAEDRTGITGGWSVQLGSGTE